MVKIRLARHGVKDKIYYRIVVVDEKRKRSGKTLDIIGFWNPLKDNKNIDKNKLKYWTERGAVLTKAIEKII